MSDPLGDAVAAASRGDLIVFPTDTVYGIGARPDLAEATARLFDAKHRPATLTLPVLCASAGDARLIAGFDERAERLAAAHWPGPLTLVLPRTEVSRPWDLGGDRASIGVRVPAHPMALALLSAGPLAVTSANRSGAPPATTCDELVGAFGDLVAVYLCEDEPLVGVASTVVSLTGETMELLRAGDLDPETLRRLSAG